MPLLDFGQKLPSDLYIDSNNNSSFIIGVDSFSDIEIQSKPEKDTFYYFFNKSKNRLVKQFILDKRDRVDYICHVTLIKKEDKFTPRIDFSIRDKFGKILSGTIKEGQTKYKARVSMEQCHKNFWDLISFLQSIRNIDTPNSYFSLVSQEENEIIEALRGRGADSIKTIIKRLAIENSISLSDDEIGQLLDRKKKVQDFEDNLDPEKDNEKFWQNFFEENKWIFGYGLNYEILKLEEGQPHYGGTKVDGTGGQKGDYLTSTTGDLSFTVLVEIKTPNTPLLQGQKENRTGSWSLSQDLTDAISQLQANIDKWNKFGSEQPDNRDKLEKNNIFTVQPKGIIVIGSLDEVKEIRSKRETFQRFRKSIHGIDILTFDELFNRAKFIIREKKQHVKAN